MKRAAFQAKALLLAHMLAFTALPVTQAQPTASIAGTVVDAKTAAALASVNITLAGTAFGTATGENGAFTLHNLPPGQYRLVVQIVGYRTHTQAVTLAAGEKITLSLSLEPVVVSGEEISIERQRVEDARLEISPATYDIDPKMIEAQAGAFEDIFRVVQTLPGVVTPNDFSNQFIVRGGSPNQNLIIMDGVELYSPYRRNGMASVFNPAIVQDVKLYAGGFPALFGDRLSSVLAVTSREGTSKKWLAGRFGSSLTNANLVLEGKTGMWNGSWLLSGRRSYYDLFARDFVRDLGIVNDIAFPDFRDLQAKILLRPHPKHRLQFTGFYSKNIMDYLVKEEVGEQVSENSAFDGEDRMENSIIGSSWTYTPSAALQTRVFAHWYQNSGRSGLAGRLASAGSYFGKDFFTGEIITTIPPGGQADTLAFDFDQQYDFNKISVGNWWIYSHGKHVLEFGIGADFAENELASAVALDEYGQIVFETLAAAPNFFGSLANTVEQKQAFTRANFYLQDKISLKGDGFWMQPGIRFDRYGQIGKSYLSPRLNLFFALRPQTSMRLATGIYRQSPGYEKLLDGGRIFDFLQFSALDELVAESAVHLIAGLTEEFHPQWRLTIEGYYKYSDDLIVQNLRQLDQPAPTLLITGGTKPALPAAYRIETKSVVRQTSEPVNAASVTAYGVDFQLEKRMLSPDARWGGSLSLSLGKATQEQRLTVADGVQQTFTFPFDYDRRFSANAAFHFSAGAGFQLSANWQYGSGLPFTQALRATPLLGTATDTTIVAGEVVVSETPFVLADPVTGYARFIPDFGLLDNRNRARLPAYHRLDVRFSYSGTIGTAPFSVYLDLVNLYNRKNVFQYQPIIHIEGDDPNLPLALRFPKPVLAFRPTYMLPFVPSIGMAFSF